MNQEAIWEELVKYAAAAAAFTWNLLISAYSEHEFSRIVVVVAIWLDRYVDCVVFFKGFIIIIVCCWLAPIFGSRDKKALKRI